MSKTLILSDIHFANSSSSANSPQALLPLLDDVNTLILNGDTAETLSKKLRGYSVAMTEELIALANETGVEVVLVTGNHDPDISQTDYMERMDKRVLIMHGHAILEGIAPWSWRAPLISSYMKTRPSPDSLDSVLSLVTETALQVGTDAIESKMPSTLRLLAMAPSSVFHILKSWMTFPRRTHEFLKKYSPNTTVCITGHTHRQGVWHRDGVVIINTGCFGKCSFPSAPLAVLLDDEQRSVIVKRIKKTKGCFTRSKTIAEIQV